MEKFLEVVNFDISGVSVGRIIIGLLIVVFAMFVRRLFDTIFLRRLQNISESTKTEYDDKILSAIRRPIDVFILFSGFYIALRYLNFPTSASFDVNKFIHETYKVLVATIFVWMLYRLTDIVSVFVLQRFSKADAIMEKQFVPLLRRSVRMFIIIVGVLLIIQNLGYSVGSLLTGLGIGGLAVALAAQETLSNFFSSIMLITDMPFRVGDWIKFSDVEGVVEVIGFRTTRVRTFEKSLITVPNKILTNGPIENFTTRDRRRIKMNLSITYDTPADKIEAFVNGIQKLIQNHEQVHQDFYLVRFNHYLDSGLNIFVYLFTRTIDWAEYLKIREEINLSIFRLAESLGVEFAFPSHTVYWGQGQQQRDALT